MYYIWDRHLFGGGCYLLLGGTTVTWQNLLQTGLETGLLLGHGLLQYRFIIHVCIDDNKGKYYKVYATFVIYMKFSYAFCKPYKIDSF